MRLLYSARTLDDVIYRDELDAPRRDDAVDIRLTLTREWPEGWSGYRRRIDRELLDEVAWRPEERPLVYVCGPTGFVEAAAGALVELGHDPGRIRTERFGSTVRHESGTLMEALDGNAIAGLLFDVFGAEMTTATGVCASCGASGPVAELDGLHSRAREPSSAAELCQRADGARHVRDVYLRRPARPRRRSSPALDQPGGLDGRSADPRQDREARRRGARAVGARVSGDATDADRQRSSS